MSPAILRPHVWPRAGAPWRVAALAVVTASLLLAACGSSPQAAPGPSAGGASGRHHPTTTTPATSPPTTTPTTTPPTTTTAPTTTTTTAPPGQALPHTTTPVEQAGWTPVAVLPLGIAVDERTIAGSAGASVTVIRFNARFVRYDLHVGSQDPPTGNAVIGPDSGPAIGPDEGPLLLSAFNGGFKMVAGAGGVELNGQVLSPLVPGLASLVIDTDGQARLGVWGQTVPVPGEQVQSVRQNLAPLVVGSRPSPSIGNVGAWGATLGGGAAVPRSALGEDAAGNLLYAGTMSAVPVDLASALLSAGAVTAMELDINPEWVQAVVAASPGGPLQTVVPGQYRPADQYQVGWTRDFVTVLSAAPAAG
jgi:hypothetical protein